MHHKPTISTTTAPPHDTKDHHNTTTIAAGPVATNYYHLSLALVFITTTNTTHLQPTIDIPIAPTTTNDSSKANHREQKIPPTLPGPDLP
uniref:Uncharacterized protein n=1 Tax=Populus trichocarpa TaxID=3694 RepID=A0A3N7FVP9_POPTR